MIRPSASRRLLIVDLTSKMRHLFLRASPLKSKTCARTTVSDESFATAIYRAGVWSSATRFVARFATSSVCGKPIAVSKASSHPILKSDLTRVDAHRISRSEYAELPELTEETLARATVSKGGRPRSANPRQLISLRLPAAVVARWRATGPGWQTRMAERLSKVTARTHVKGET